MERSGAAAEIAEKLKLSPKLTSRRKKNRPVKYSEHLFLTEPPEDLPHFASDLSPVSPVNFTALYTASIRNEEANGGHKEGNETPQDFPPADDRAVSDESEEWLPPTMQRAIKRRVTSIRDSSLLRAGNAKKTKLQDISPEQQPSQPKETETTFSSLLHNFASQVHSRVESAGPRSPYKERSPVPDAIWPLKSGSPSVLPRKDHHSPPGVKQMTRQPVDEQIADKRQDMSFSGLLQNFVSCVNDTSMPSSVVQQPTLISMLTTRQHGQGNRVPATEGHCAVTNQGPERNEQQSFAGLLHNFATVVDKGVQGPLQQKGYQVVESRPQHSNEDIQQNKPKVTKSLLDVLHDTISKRVLESAVSSDDPTDDHAGNKESGSPEYGNQIDSPNSMDPNFQGQPRVSNPKDSSTLQEKGCTKEDDSPKSNSAGWSPVQEVVKLEPMDDLHPNCEQWSHIQNVLPPIDDTEEDTKMQPERQDGEDSAIVKKGSAGSKSSTPCNSVEGADHEVQQFPSSTPVSNGSDQVEEGFQVVVKQEPPEEVDSVHWDTSNPVVNCTLRERLLSRLGAKRTPYESPLPSSPAASPMDTSYGNAYDEDALKQKDSKRSSPNDSGDGTGSRPQNQGGLVSHLLNTDDSAHWKAKKSGSFADFLHDITSSVLEKDSSVDGSKQSPSSQPAIKQEPLSSDEEPQSRSDQLNESHGDTSTPVNSSSFPLSAMIAGEHGGGRSSAKKKVPRCISRLLPDPIQSSASKGPSCSEGNGKRSQKMREISYAESSVSTSSEDTDPSMPASSKSSKNRAKVLQNVSGHQKHSPMMKGRWKRSPRHGLKIKQGWPKRRDDFLKRSEVNNPHVTEEPNDGNVQLAFSGTQHQVAVSSAMSFTDILQKLAQKCQAGGEGSPTYLSASNQRSSQGHVTGIAPVHHEHFVYDKPQPSTMGGSSALVQSSMPDVANSNLRNLLLQEGTLAHHQNINSTSESPSTSVQSHDVSFANLMQNMATTVTKNNGTCSSQKAYEDLTNVEPPPPWIKSLSDNWLRFLIVTPDENPKVAISVSVNLWNKIHEVKIHCHHLEVPVNHWIFRRFGKRIHTRAALFGILQAICNGCSVCEGTTRSDLVQMYRNKLASTSRWQAAAVLEESFGSATIRSSQCELLVSGLRRSREKRCSKCSQFVDRKLKAVMYHLRKKLGLS